jgi:hypothetical protein
LEQSETKDVPFGKTLGILFIMSATIGAGLATGVGIVLTVGKIISLLAWFAANH